MYVCPFFAYVCLLWAYVLRVQSLIMTALTSVGVPEEKLTPAQVMARKSVEYFQMQQASRAGVGSTAARKASRLRGSRPGTQAPSVSGLDEGGWGCGIVSSCGVCWARWGVRLGGWVGGWGSL